MKKNLILASLAALALVPSTAMAQPDRHDRHDVREARRDVREAQRDLRDAKWDYRHEVRDYNRTHPWNARFRYQRFTVGARIQPAYFGNRYVITDYGRFRWARPGVNQRWVRHFDDALLVNVRTGRVVKVVYNAFR
ncbi:RcnB family protein [Sphingobium nicotianae]|uniref:RcnB family protein n=1 Tax=Sphingobium nicotianae TaxID=2782607 RepID=A0A9X1DA34_9SPHN|nr:RcnB family protein [Sphingobium nicotianae]MBT2186197.1 RcnB family protein [Sphingobium nicotianae]